MSEKCICDEATFTRMVARLAHEIIEHQQDDGELYLVGIKRRGVPLTRYLKQNIEKFSDLRVTSGELDITFYRDDLIMKYENPKLNDTDIPFDVTNRKIILVDDVLFTGRTARAAMDALISLGRPSKIELCVMVDRGHRELPISANYVGKNIPTSRSEFVSVKVREYDGIDSVYLSDREKDC